MKALIIIGVILVFLLLLLFARIRVSLLYDGRLRLHLSYWTHLARRSLSMLRKQQSAWWIGATS